MSSKLEKLKKSQTLASIRRESIDGLRIQGFVLAYSKDLILIQYVYDFNVDGIMVLRRSDISEIDTDKTDIFQTQILKDEGLFAEVDFQKEYDVKDWPTVLNSVGKDYGLVIVEDEISEDPEFLLGEIQDIKNNSVSILGFTGAANWHKEPTEINYEDISSFQAGNNYSKMYKRYFERNALTSGSTGRS